jgi:dihydropteroate synthase
MTILHDLGLGRRTLVMGVLNVTPDSFSDGGRFSAPEAAIERALAMLEEGADIVDIGGESTRPATFRDESPLDPADEIGRILPVIQGLAKRRPGVCISVDSYKVEVAEVALEAGANVLNDVSGLGHDPRMADLAAQSCAPLILMHMPGVPRRLPENPHYDDVMADICAYFRERIAIAQRAGVRDEQIVLDPGIGFGKSAEQSLEVIRRLPELRAMGFPVLSGPSRKSFLGKLLDGSPPDDRLDGTAAAVALSISGGADIVRVHDVRFMARLARVCDAILGQRAT